MGMAIPRDTNAVFYHPLNTREESVSGAVWDGTAKFSPGKVALALAGAEALAFGAETQFSAVRVLSGPPVMAALGGGMVAVAYLAEANSAWVKIGQASAGTVAWGAGVQLASGYADRVALAAVSSGVAVVSHHRTIDSSSTVSVFDLAGTDATLRESSPILGTVDSLGALSANAFAVSFLDGTGGSGAVGTLSGGLAFGPPVSYATGAVAGSLVLPMSSGGVLQFYEDSVSIKVRPGAISGSPLRPAWGPAVTIAAGQGSPRFSGAAITTGSFVVAYVDSAGARVASGTFGGGVPVLGPPIPGTLPGPASVAAAGGALVAMMYRVPTSPDDRGASLLATVSGLSMTLGAETQFSVASGSMDFPGLAAAGGQVFAAYSEGIAGRGRVGGVSAAAAMFAPSGGLNPTAIGAGRVVFMSWTRNPSA